MDGFTRRKEQSKEEIRSAAWELFNQFGVKRVSMNDIARKAGVSHATIYNNFGSKDQLIQEYVSFMVDQLMNQATRILTLEEPFDQKIDALFQFITEMVSQNQSSLENPVFTPSIDLQADPEMKKIHDTALEQMTQLVMALVAEGKEQGQVNAELSDDALGIYFRMFMDVFVHPENQRQFYQAPDLIQDLKQLMLKGLG